MPSEAAKLDLFGKYTFQCSRPVDSVKGTAFKSQREEKKEKKTNPSHYFSLISVVHFSSSWLSRIGGEGGARVFDASGAGAADSIRRSLSIQLSFGAFAARVYQFVFLVSSR